MLSDPASYLRGRRPQMAKAWTTGCGGSASKRRCRGRCVTRRYRSGSAARQWRRSPRPASSGSTRSTRPSPRRPAPAREPFFAEKSSLRASVSCCRALPERPRAVPGARLPRHGLLDVRVQREARRERLRARKGEHRHGVRRRARAAGRHRSRAHGSVGATARIWSATRSWCWTPRARLPACSIISASTRARAPSGPCWSSSRRTCPSCASTRPATPPELGRPLAHGPRPRAGRGLRTSFRPGAGAVRLRARIASSRAGARHRSRDRSLCRNKPVGSR